MKTSEAKNDETVIHAYDEKYKELGEKIEKISNEVKTLKVQLKKQNFTKCIENTKVRKKPDYR